MKRWDIIIGLVAALLLALILSPFASPWPDGLERVAERLGFLKNSEGREVIRSPIPDYLIPGVKDERIATAIAGGMGTILVFGVGYAAGAILKRNRQR